MKFFTQSGAVKLAEFTAGSNVIVVEGVGISVVPLSVNIGSVSTITYTVSLDGTLENLSNTPASASSNQILIKGSANAWEAIDYTFATLGDVTVSSLDSGQVPIYNTSTNKWVNGYFRISQGGDVELTNLQEFQFLQWNGNKWGNTFITLSELVDVTISPITVALGDVLYYNGTGWVNTPLQNVIGGTLTILSTPVSNSSTTQQNLKTYTIDSTLAINHSIFEVEAHFDVTHTSDNTEIVELRLDGSITLASATITSGSTWKCILKTKIIALTGDTCFFSEKVVTTSTRGLDVTSTEYSSTTSFIIGADHNITAWVDPGVLGAAGTINCNLLYVKLVK